MSRLLIHERHLLSTLSNTTTNTPEVTSAIPEPFLNKIENFMDYLAFGYAAAIALGGVTGYLKAG